MKISRLLIFLCLANLLVFLIIIPMFFTKTQGTADTSYMWVHGTAIDYYHYLGIMKEGANGSWLVSDLYNTVPHKQSLVFFFFIIAGKIGGIFHLSPIITYHLIRFISIEFMFVATYLVCVEVVGGRRGLWAAIVGLFTTVPPVMYLPIVKTYLGDFAWWDVLDSLHRADYLPHHSFGIGLLLISTLLVMKFFRQGKIHQILIASLTAFASGIVYPIVGFVFVAVIIATSIIYLGKQYRKHHLLKINVITPVIVVTICACFSLLIMKQQVSLGYPWDQYNVGYGVWEQVNDFTRNFFIAYSVILIFSLPALIFYLLKSEKFSEILIGIWALIPFMLIIVAPLLGLEKIRMAYLGQFIPYGILITTSIFIIFKRLPTLLLKRIYIGTSMLILIANTTLTTGYYFQKRLVREVHKSGIYHLDKKLFPAYAFIDNHVPLYANVLGDFVVGSTLPAFATVKTYFGHWTQTSDYWRKEGETRTFLEGQYSPAEALTFLTKGNIEYIVVRTVDQKQSVDAMLRVLPLETIYTDGDIAIYKVGKKILTV